MKCILSVGVDDTIFNNDGEPFNRQASYGSIINDAGFNYSILVLTRNRSLRILSDKNLMVIPLYNSIYNRYIGIFFKALKLHRKNKIVAATSQSPSDYAWPLLLFCRLFNIPFVGQIHFDIFSPYAINEVYGPSLIGHLRYLFTLKSLRYYTVIRVVGRRIADIIIEKKILPPHKVNIIPVMVPMLNNSLQKLQKPLRKSVLFVGRLVPMKNLKLWLHVSKKVLEKQPDIVFDLVGDGPLKEELYEYSKELGIENQVIFHGFKEYKELGSFYRNSSIFLLTSNYEGFGRVIVEAFANGLPVVSTYITGAEDIIIDGETGYLVERDINIIASRILDFINNEDKVISFGEKGYQYVKHHFDPEKLKKEWVVLLISQAKNSKETRHFKKF
jgi:glycosyltransferase involved in cell wall biosynthesis